MREIKFRAWIGTHKLMFQVREMIIPDGLNEAGMQEIAATDNYSIVRPMHYIQPILMQYTGLHDKNGKEIYEGDILVPYETGNKHTVIFELGAFALSRHDGWRQLINHASDNNGIILEEVIGNIYENPELLK